MKTRFQVWIKGVAFIVLATYLVSCVKEVGSEDGVEPELSEIESLQVADGFDYEMWVPQQVNVQFTTTGGRFSESKIIQYAIIGTDTHDEVYGLKSGFINLQAGLSLTIDKPLHLNQLYLYTKHQGNARFFEITDQVLNLTSEELMVSEGFFESTSGRLTKGPSCTSFLGNATKIKCDENSITIKSSASFLYVDVTFLDGTLSRIEPGDEGALNAKQNSWTFNNFIDLHPIGEARLFTVYADCQTSPKMVGTELVTFANPCLITTTDTDNDGVADEYDIKPNNSDISSVAYYPAHNRYATFAYEDLWPHKGDYDFNDLVVSHLESIYTNADNFVTQVDVKFVVRAIGARFDNDLCMSFTDSRHALTVVDVSLPTINYEQIELDGYTELRFKHIRNLFSTNTFINTDTTKSHVEPITVTLSLSFDGSTNIDDFEIDEFLRINQEEGREVHKPGVSFTSLVDQNLISFADDDTQPSEGKYYKTKENLPWVLEIPVEWDYPKEKSGITEGYPNFKEFVRNNGKTPWYTDDEGNKVHKHLYRKR